MGDAKYAIDGEYHRSIERQRYLHAAKRELEDGFIMEAMADLIRVVELLSASEERVMRLHAECFSMLEHAGKILALDASLRPVIVKLDGPPAPDGGEGRWCGKQWGGGETIHTCDLKKHEGPCHWPGQ